MESQAGILDLLRQAGAEAVKRSRRAVIIQPGAIGDCIVTLPLAQFIKKTLRLGAIEMIGRSDYISYFPSRTCIDRIRSIDAIEMQRLFSPAGAFKLKQRDGIVDAFAGYSWVLSFLGDVGGDFEQNLIFAANCSQSSEVIVLPSGIDSTQTSHISIRHIRNFCSTCGIQPPQDYDLNDRAFITPAASDSKLGFDILRQAGVNIGRSVFILCPGAGRRDKCWHLQNFIRLAACMRPLNIEPVFLIGPAEQERFSEEDISTLAQTATILQDLSLTEVLQMLSVADGFIGNDSGITHLAATAGLATIALFGPTSSQVYRPLGPKVCVIDAKGDDFASNTSQVIQQQVLRAISRYRRIKK